MACLCNAFAQRVRAGFGAALARVTSGPPPPSKYPASALRASAVAARGTRPPAVNAPQNLRPPFLGDRFLLSPLVQLVDFPYRLGDVVDLQQSPRFHLHDRLGLLPWGKSVDFHYRLRDVVDLQHSRDLNLRDRLALSPLVDSVDFSNWTSAAPLPTMAKTPQQLDLCTHHQPPAGSATSKPPPVTPSPSFPLMGISSR